MFAVGIVGIAVLLFIGYIASVNRKAINCRTIGIALALQMGIGAMVIYFPPGRAALQWFSAGVETVLHSGAAGVNFLFGNLVNFSVDGIGFVFALNVLPLVIFFSALIAVLYHFGIMQVVIRVIGGALSKLLGTSQSESMSAVANVFVGSSEAPLVVKPVMPKMSDSEFFAIMCGGLASVSGTVLGGYAMMGVSMEYLLAASFMAAPGGLLFAKLIIPETKTPDYVIDKHIQFSDEPADNVLGAIGEGAISGVKLAAAIGGMLMAIIGLVALVNNILGSAGDLVGVPLSLEIILGWIFSPVAFLIGVPWSEAMVAGSMIGKKIILNEFVAYGDFSAYLKDAETVMASGLPVLSEKTKAIISFALCGFANLGSMGILVGGIGSLCPARKQFITKFGLKALIAGTCSNLMSAAIAGIFISMTI